MFFWLSYSFLEGGGGGGAKYDQVQQVYLFQSSIYGMYGPSICLKGRVHKIFDFRFFHESSSPGLLMYYLLTGVDDTAGDKCGKMFKRTFLIFCF
jgi:hypothetical protein